jgi:hypothetical protein
VLVTPRGDRLVLRVGAGTRTNVIAHPDVCLTWMREHLDYQLIVDGTASLDDAVPGDDDLYGVSVEVVRGVLHRLAGRTDAGPSCRPLRSPDGAIGRDSGS